MPSSQMRISLVSVVRRQASQYDSQVPIRGEIKILLSHRKRLDHTESKASTEVLGHSQKLKLSQLSLIQIHLSRVDPPFRYARVLPPRVVGDPFDRADQCVRLFPSSAFFSSVPRHSVTSLFLQ